MSLSSQCVFVLGYFLLPVFSGRGGSGVEEMLRGNPQGRRRDSRQRHRPAEVWAQKEVSALRGQGVGTVGGAGVRYVTITQVKEAKLVREN